MARSLDYAKEYYMHAVEINVAVRWACPQTLVRGTFNEGSDVWSLMCAYIELYSHGNHPYRHLDSTRTVYERILFGERPTPAPDTPPGLASVMVTTWALTTVVDVDIGVFDTVWAPEAATATVTEVAV
jgi:hypothetical protein